MKHIIIDARLYGPKHTGIGRYTKNLLLALTKQSDFKKYRFTLIIHTDQLDEVKTDLGTNYHYIPVSIRHYSFAEQIFLPFLLYRLHPDLVHFTHFNKPLFYFGNSVITIHDLIKHFYKGRETTTRSPLLYWPKYISYRLLTFFVIKTSAIIVPSNYWRDYLIKNFHLKPESVTTTYEAVDPRFLSLNQNQYSAVPKPYIIYTGNLYPHKNIQIILKALKKLPNITLKIICSRSIFSQRIEEQIHSLHLEKQIEFLGYVKDEDFRQIYSSALALVHPSLMEGFSLTGLEAMALNCPVISSNSSCLPEIYQDSVLYFNPNNPDELVNQINLLSKNSRLRKKLIESGKKLLQRYSWDKTARETISVYEQKT